MELFGLEAPLLNATDTENLAFNLYVLDIEERQEQINQLIKFLISLPEIDDIYFTIKKYEKDFIKGSELILSEQKQIAQKILEQKRMYFNY